MGSIGILRPPTAALWPGGPALPAPPCPRGALPHASATRGTPAAGPAARLAAMALLGRAAPASGGSCVLMASYSLAIVMAEKGGSPNTNMKSDTPSDHTSVGCGLQMGRGGAGRGGQPGRAPDASGAQPSALLPPPAASSGTSGAHAPEPACSPAGPMRTGLACCSLRRHAAARASPPDRGAPQASARPAALASPAAAAHL
jgi:hypothetical protein